MQSLQEVETHEDLQSYLLDNFADVIERRVAAAQPATDALFARLTAVDEERILELSPPEAQSLLQRQETRRPTLLKVGTLFDSISASKIGIPSAVPPPEIHRMQRKDPLWCGDFYSANMLVQALEDGGQTIRADGRYLDFGCSSGSLTRVMRALHPQSNWYGADPVESSIKWAAENIAGIEFVRSEQRPPLSFSFRFDGVYAISVWSHFSETAALDWFSEMARLVRPGGWLAFTAHGITTFWHRTNRGIKRPDMNAELLKEMRTAGFAFEPVVKQDGLDMTDWGNAFFSIEWVATRLLRDWAISSWIPGRNQMNQDIYILTRKP